MGILFRNGLQCTANIFLVYILASTDYVVKVLYFLRRATGVLPTHRSSTSTYASVVCVNEVGGL